MPTYEYACDGCGHRFDEFQSITAKPLRVCPQCEKPKLRRLISAGAGVIFKGSGFYETDYRSESYRKAADAEKPAAAAGGEPSAGSSAASKDPAPAAKADAATSDAKPAASQAASSPPPPKTSRTGRRKTG